MKIQSNKENLTISSDRVFNALLNFTRNQQAPSIPQITNWTVLENGCSFTINDMVTCTFKLTEQIPFSKVTYLIDTDKGFSANADFLIEDNGANSDVQIIAEADAPIFMQPMIKGPVQQALNKALERIKEMVERNC